MIKRFMYDTTHNKYGPEIPGPFVMGNDKNIHIHIISLIGRLAYAIVMKYLTHNMYVYLLYACSTCTITRIAFRTIYRCGKLNFPLNIQVHACACVHT